MDWQHIAAIVTALIGTGGAGAVLGRWLQYRRTREQSVDERAWRLIDELQATVDSLRGRFDTLLSQHSSLITQQTTIQAEAQQAREARIQMQADLDEARREIARLGQLLKEHGIEDERPPGGGATPGGP